ncbi:unnamed protein product [Mortierella alpina]
MQHANAKLPTPSPPPPPSSSSSRFARVRPQPSQPSHQRPPHPLVQQHQPFPSSASSFSLRNSSSSTSSLFGLNDSTRISFTNGTGPVSSHNSSLSNSSYSSNTFSFAGQYQNQPSSLDRRAVQSQSFVESASCSGAGTRSATAVATAAAASTAHATTTPAGTRGMASGRLRPFSSSSSAAHESAALLDSTSSERNSLYTIDDSRHHGNMVQSPDFEYDDDDDDGSQAEDGVSYFGTAGQDYLLKQKRARRARALCWLDGLMLVLFTSIACLRPPETGDGGEPGLWIWDWTRIPWPLTAMAIVRIMLMSFTVRYSHGNYNAMVIFVCVIITLFTMFEVNMIIQHRLGLGALLISQYAVSTLLTQLHWITYSAHTPMSAALAYYDPLLTDSITFSRESRYIGSAPPHSRSLAAATPVRRGTSYGTMSGPSQFDTLQEMDEEERLDDDNDQDAFIKVNVNIRSNTHGTRGASYRPEGPLAVFHNQGATEDRQEDHLENLNDHEDNDDEEQDMATLLAFQDARRQQVYAFSPTASSSAMPVRSILSPQSPPRDSSNPNRTPLSWAFCAGQEAYSSSYDMRMAAAGASGAAAVSGGLTVGYTPRKRSLRRSNLDPNGTGRRTWTGGHSIIYSGIFVEDSDDDDNDDNDDVEVEVAAKDEKDPEVDVDALVDADVGVDSDHPMEDDACPEACLHLSLEKTQDDRTLTGSEGMHAASDGTVKAEFDDNIKIEVDVAVDVAVAVETDMEHTIKVEVDGDRVHAVMDGTIKTEVLDTDSGAMVEVSVETVAVESDTTTITETHTAEIIGVHKQQDQDVKLTDAPDHDSVHGDLGLVIRATESHMGNTHHPHFKDPSAATVDQEAAIDISTPGGEPNGRHLTDGHHHHGLSTLKFNVSSRKDITAVVCDEDDCEEHPYQEGPAAELEAAIGSGFLGGHIVQLDIKESSTSAMERTGDGINDFEDSSLPGTIKGLILPPPHDANGTGTELRMPGAVDGLQDHSHEDDSEEGHGSRQTRVRERIETVRVELETDGPIDPSNPAISAIIAGLETPDRRSPGPVTTVEDLSEGEEGHRRIHVRERIEQITVEEDDSVIGIVKPGGAIVGGVVGVIGGGAGDNPSAIIIDSTKPLPRPPSPDRQLLPVPIPVSVPGQWTSIDETEQPTGVITWGYVDDITPPDQGSYGIGVVSEPAIYVPRQRPAIVQPLLPEPVTVVRPAEPLIAVGPTRGPIVVPSRPQPLIPLQPTPGPILQQPQPGMIMRPQPQPVVYAPPRRPVIVPPRPAMPPPVPMIQPPSPVIMAPQPQVIIPQVQPQIIAPTQAIVPQPAIMAPTAPILQPEYGTYETIVPGAVGVGGIAGGMGGVGGVGGVGAWPGGAVGPLQRRHSIASIYEDRSIASIYEAENRSVASVYDDRTIVSIDGGIRGAGVGGALAVGMQGRHNRMAGRPLSGMEYGHHHHLASAAHTAAPVDSQRTVLVADRSGGLVWDPEAGIYVRSRHAVRYSDPLRYDGGDGYSEDVYAGQRTESSRRGSWQEQGFIRAVDLDPRNVTVNRHVALPSESADSEMAYQEIELADGPQQLQEMVTETYFDTTRTQLKVREQKGQLIADVIRRLKDRQQRQQQSPQELRQVSHATQQRRQQPESPPLSDQGVVDTPLSPPSNVSLLSRSLQNQQHPPTLNIPKPPSNPPPVRLLMNRGMAANQSQPRGMIPLVTRSPISTQSNGSGQGTDEDDKDSLPILSTSSKKVETIMLQARHHKVPVPSAEPFTVQDGSAGFPRTRPPVSGGVLTALVPVTAASSVPMLARQDAASKPVWGIGGVTAAALVSPPSPSVHRKVPDGLGAAVSAAAVARKAKKKQHVPPMSRHQLHPILLTEGVMACWNNEFGGALEMFKEHAGTYPRWSLAAAEVHITRQLISGQLSEADSELIDALQLSEKVATRILDKKQELDSSFMSYRSICSADATLVMVNDNTLRQNYKWDCEMALYDTLLYRGILQLTSSADTKGTFSDIKGGLQLRRAWKGYMRIKQEIEAAKEKWQKLSAIVEESGRGKEGPAEKENKPPAVNKEHAHAKTSGAPSAHVGVNALPPRPSRTATMPVPIPPTTSNGKRNTTLLSTSQPTEGSRWSIFGRRGSVSHSAASLSTSPADGTEIAVETNDRTRSKILSSSNPVAPKGLASALRDQAKAAEDFKTAVRVLEDVEDYLQYGLGLFFFIVSIVPKSLLPALKTIGLQSNHEQGIKHLEAVFTRKNGRAPFAALFLLINYLFLPRGMDDPKISLGRAGDIISECLKSCPNGSSYLLMACHHARKTGSMIPAALNHITRGIQTCEAAGIPSINYRFELGLTFFINQEFGKAADIFEILWRRFTMNMAISVNGSGAAGMEGGRRRKGRSSSLGSSLQAQLAAAAQTPVGGMEEEEEDDFELAPFCGLCLVASKVVMRLGQEGYFEYGRDGFGRGCDEVTSPMALGVSSEGVSGSTTPLNYPRTGPESDLLMAAQEVLAMMAGSDLGGSTMKSASGGSIFEHTKAGSNQSTWSNKDMDGSSAHLPPPPAHAGKLNRFNKFAWNQCQKSLQRGRISPFLPLVILYLRRDLAYMKPVLLRKFRTLVETIWKSIPQPTEGDTQAIYLLLSAVVHRQLLPDDSTFAYTALTDCLLLESTIESEMWVIPHCHYELGELLFKKLHLPQAALEQFQWIVKGPGKEARPTSIFYASTISNSNPRLSVFGGGFPSDSVTNLVESAAAAAAAAAAGASQHASQGRQGGGREGGHSHYPSTTSNHRLSQLFLGGTSPTPMPGAQPPNPVTFYNSRYKKFEFSQVLRQRSSICLEQIQKVIDSGDTGSASSSRRTSMNWLTSSSSSSNQQAATAPNKNPVAAGHGDATTAEAQQRSGQSLKRHSSQLVEAHGELGREAGGVKAARLSSEAHAAEGMEGVVSGGASASASVSVSAAAVAAAAVAASQSWGNSGSNSNTLPNILSDAQRKRGSQQLGLPAQLRPSPSFNGLHK